MLKVVMISIPFGLAIGLFLFREKAIGVRIIGGLGFSIILSVAFLVALITGGDH